MITNILFILTLCGNPVFVSVQDSYGSFSGTPIQYDPQNLGFLQDAKEDPNYTVDEVDISHLSSVVECN